MFSKNRNLSLIRSAITTAKLGSILIVFGVLVEVSAGGVSTILFGALAKNCPERLWIKRTSFSFPETPAPKQLCNNEKNKQNIRRIRAGLAMKKRDSPDVAKVIAQLLLFVVDELEELDDDVDELLLDEDLTDSDSFFAADL
jgi:hypothetical protein